MNNVLIDTGFWYALFDSRDPEHSNANDLVQYLELGNVIVPYPILYETINTRFSRNRSWVEEFEKTLKNDNIKILEDAKYQESALSLTFASTLVKNRPLSMIDMVLRLMLDDTSLNIDYLISFNTGDFIDICLKNRIELISK